MNKYNYEKLESMSNLALRALYVELKTQEINYATVRNIEALRECALYIDFVRDVFENKYDREISPIRRQN